MANVHYNPRTSRPGETSAALRTGPSRKTTCPARVDEIERMSLLVEQGMREGAVGELVWNDGKPVSGGAAAPGRMIRR